MNKSVIIKTQQVTLFALLGIVIFLLAIIVTIFVVAKDYRKFINCGSFASHEEALRAYTHYPRLDRDKDGQPCELLHNEPM